MLLKEMIVTDADGKIENAKGEKLTGKCIQSEDMYSFYAIKQVNLPKSKPTSEQKAAKVKIMMPLGGELNGMYRFPRVGEKVVVAVEGAAHYLMGYLPSKEMPFSPKKDGKEKTTVFDDEGLVLRYKKTGANTSDGQYSELSFTKKPVEWASADSALQKDAVSKVVTKDGKKSYFPYVDQVNLSSTGDIKSHAEYLNEISAQRVSMQAKFLNTGNTKKGTLKELTPNYGEIDKGDVYISADRRIILDAREGVLLKCGPVKVGLTQTALELCCGKLGGPDERSGPFDSSITLGTNGDFNMQGKKFMGSFDRSVSLFDGFGGNLSMTMGRTTLSGSAVTIEASTTLSSIFNGLIGLTNLIDQVASLYTQNKGMAHVAKQTFILSNVAQTIGSFATKTAGQKKPKKSADYVSAALDIAYNIFDLVRTVFERKRADQYALHYDPKTKKFYNDDNRFTTWAACMIVDLSLQAAMLGLMLGTSMDAFIHKATISLSPHADISLDSRKYLQLAIMEQEAEGPAAGVEVGSENEGDDGSEHEEQAAPGKKDGTTAGNVTEMVKTLSKVAMLETKTFAKYSMDDSTMQALKDL